MGKGTSGAGAVGPVGISSKRDARVVAVVVEGPVKANKEARSTAIVDEKVVAAAAVVEVVVAAAAAAAGILVVVGSGGLDSPPLDVVVKVGGGGGWGGGGAGKEAPAPASAPAVSTNSEVPTFTEAFGVKKEVAEGLVGGRVLGEVREVEGASAAGENRCRRLTVFLTVDGPTPTENADFTVLKVAVAVFAVTGRAREEVKRGGADTVESSFTRVVPAAWS